MSDKKKLEYSSIKEDWEDLKDGFDGIEKAKAGAKIFGKTALNIGKFFVNNSDELKERLDDQIAKSKK